MYIQNHDRICIWSYQTSWSSATNKQIKYAIYFWGRSHSIQPDLNPLSSINCITWVERTATWATMPCSKPDLKRKEKLPTCVYLRKREILIFTKTKRQKEMEVTKIGDVIKVYVCLRLFHRERTNQFLS